MVGRAGAAREALPLQESHRVGCQPWHELVDETGLPDAGVADDRDKLSPALGCTLQNALSRASSRSRPTNSVGASFVGGRAADETRSHSPVLGVAHDLELAPEEQGGCFAHGEAFAARRGQLVEESATPAPWRPHRWSPSRPSATSMRATSMATPIDSPAGRVPSPRARSRLFTWQDPNARHDGARPGPAPIRRHPRGPGRSDPRPGPRSSALVRPVPRALAWRRRTERPNR